MIAPSPWLRCGRVRSRERCRRSIDGVGHLFRARACSMSPRDLLNHLRRTLRGLQDLAQRFLGLLADLDSSSTARAPRSTEQSRSVIPLHALDQSRSPWSTLRRDPPDLISSATTANPLPCSPACAAMMAALSASRLVCSATVSMTPECCQSPRSYRQAGDDADACSEESLMR